MSVDVGPADLALLRLLVLVLVVRAQVADADLCRRQSLAPLSRVMETTTSQCVVV